MPVVRGIYIFWLFSKSFFLVRCYFVDHLPFPPPRVPGSSHTHLLIISIIVTVIFSCRVISSDRFIYHFILHNVNGRLASLSNYRGFRRYVKALADNVGVTGRIQRTRGEDVDLVFEGTDEQIGLFFRHLQALHRQAMFHGYDLVRRQDIGPRPVYEEFSIIVNLHRLVTRKGPHSDHEFDKLSEYSADFAYFGCVRQPDHDNDA